MTEPENMSLSDALDALSKLLPERVRAEMGTGGTEPWVYRYEAKYRGWKTVYWGGDSAQEGDLSALEYALREECDARSWLWATSREAKNQVDCYIAVPHAVGKIHSALTPVHALSLAFLAALGGQK